MIYGEHKQSIKDIMVGLADQIQWMELIRDEAKAYTKLIDYLISEWSPKNDLVSDDIEIRTVAYYADVLKEKPTTVNKWFRQIYNDIFALNERHPELFAAPDQVICTFDYSSKMDHSGFWLSLGVDIVPRVGDCFSLYFVKAVTDTTDFVVNEVTHRHQNGRTEIEIELVDKFHNTNSYRKLLIDKALFLRAISISDTYGSDWKLDDKLIRIFKGEFYNFI